MIVGTLHVLAVNSVQSLFNYYTEQLEQTPSLAEIEATNKVPEKRGKDDSDDLESESQHKMAQLASLGQEEKDDDKHVPPLYKTELILTLDDLVFSPDVDSFRDSIGEIMQQFKDTLLQVDNLVPDKYFLIIIQ